MASNRARDLQAARDTGSASISGSNKQVVRRCAIYTRKSSEEGLEQDFNSLHAQREACEAYIVSQRSEGWQVVPTAYDDGGISGGTMERPSLQRLLEAITAGKINVVVVYKIDRLTRSLADFAKMVELFDRHGVSIVAVTQQFNTTTSMGRLTLNVLLSFAQFEREVTGERIRDKIAASKRKGMWMGGVVPLGYRAVDRKLVVDPKEADLIRGIFHRYLKLPAVSDLAIELERQGIRSRNGHTLSRGLLYKLLGNPAYVGMIVHKHQIFEGQHDLIVDQETWDAVQAKLKLGAVRVSGPRVTPESTLLGKLFDENGQPLTSSHTRKGDQRYRYYVARAHQGERETSGTADTGWRLPADSLERKVRVLTNELIADRALMIQAATKAGITADRFPQLLARLESAAGIDDTLQKVVLGQKQISITIKLDGDPILEIQRTFPFETQRRAAGHKIVIPGAAPADQMPKDASLIKTIGRALEWWEKLSSGKATSAAALAAQEGFTASYVTRVLPLALMAPDLMEAIAEGSQPVQLTSMRLIHGEDLPLGWSEQRQALGFGG